jgi:nitroreductase
MNEATDELKDIKVRHRGEGGWYSREDLMQMEPACLRALFRERIHHSIEVEIYPVLLGKKELPPRFGLQPQLILEIWKERGLPADGDDFAWGMKYLKIAAKMRAGENIDIDESLPEPYSDEEMAVVHKLIWDRRSVRDWIPGKKVPDEMIERILEAGRAAPTGCNLSVTRFVVIKDREEAKWVWSDTPTPMDSCVLIVVCYDKRIYQTTGQDIMVPHNQLLDCACAGDHMCLMAHALGLGAVWLTCTKKTADNFKNKYKLPDYIEQAFHIAVGWCAKGSIKSQRMPLSEMMITRDSST